jgi:hypothetical protein
MNQAEKNEVKKLIESLGQLGEAERELLPVTGRSGRVMQRLINASREAETGLFILMGTNPINLGVPKEERERWYKKIRAEQLFEFGRGAFFHLSRASDGIEDALRFGEAAGIKGKLEGVQATIANLNTKYDYTVFPRGATAFGPHGHLETLMTRIYWGIDYGRQWLLETWLPFYRAYANGTLADSEKEFAFYQFSQYLNVTGVLRRAAALYVGIYCKENESVREHVCHVAEAQKLQTVDAANSFHEMIATRLSDSWRTAVDNGIWDGLDIPSVCPGLT